MLASKLSSQDLQALRGHLGNNRRVVAKPPTAVEMEVGKFVRQNGRLVLVVAGEKRRAEFHPRKISAQPAQRAAVLAVGIDSVLSRAH